MKKIEKLTLYNEPRYYMDKINELVDAVNSFFDKVDSIDWENGKVYMKQTQEPERKEVVYQDSDGKVIEKEPECEHEWINKWIQPTKPSELCGRLITICHKCKVEKPAKKECEKPSKPTLAILMAKAFIPEEELQGPFDQFGFQPVVDVAKKAFEELDYI